jgi:hypothetical protein
MTSGSHTGRLYAIAAAVLVFFLAWAVIAAHPWASVQAARDPRLVALTKREQKLRREAKLVKRVVDRRFADYRRRLTAYKKASASQQAAQSAPAPAGGSSNGVRVVALPPLVITRTS